jgi:tetratricopeptide (TPR) repeat protein
MSTSEAKPAPALLRPRMLAAFLVIAGFLAYLNSFSGKFVFDDQIHIVSGDAIRSLGFPTGTRPLVDLSLALNYELGRLDEWGYHAFNLVVHLLAGLALFGVVRRTLLLPHFEPREERAAGIAFAAALLWLLHPLQTQSVTYVIQRAESMMGLCYLLTMYCVVRGVTAPRPRRWFAAAIAACALGMGCKPIMVTAPVVVLLFDWLVVSGSIGQTLRRRWGLYAGLAATWIVLLVLGVVRNIFFAEAEPGVAVGFAYKGATPVEYWLSQAGVLVHYLRLSVWPTGLCLDYWWPVATGPRAIVLPGLAIAGLLAGTVRAVVHRPWLGFLGAWFFLVLAPTSIVPIRDIAVEHRMYLSLAAVTVLVALLGAHAIDALTARLSLPDAASWAARAGALFIVAGTLATLTAIRNTDYHDRLGMWRDVVAKRPENPRAHSNLALLLIRQGRDEEAIRHSEEAIRLDPDFTGAYYRLHDALLAQGRGDEANEAVIKLLSRAIEKSDTLGGPVPEPGTNPTTAADLERLRDAVRRRPNDPEAHRALGAFLAARGEDAGAVKAFEAAVRLAPGSRDLLVDLASAYMARGEQERAIENFFAAVRLAPEDSSTQRQLAFALALHGDIDATVETLGDPRLVVEAHAEAHVVHANQLAGSGQTEEAAAALRRALEINPQHPYAQLRLDSLVGSASP